jgi:hypothetical protein
MSIFHALEDGLLNDIFHDLRLLKAVGGTLMSAAVSGDELEPEEIGSLACLVHDRSNNIMQTLLDLESKGGASDTSAPPTPKTSKDWELDPVTKENIFRDAENLQDMASKIQLAAEGMCHDLGIELPSNIKEKIARQRAAQGVKALDLSAPESEPEPRKLNHYTPDLANAKVSLKAMWGYLEDLELVADDPAKVSEWAEKIHDELEKCEAA